MDIAKRLLAWFLGTFLAIWATTKSILDFVGRAITVDDFTNPTGALAKAVVWVCGTPWWVPGFLALIVILAFIVYLFSASNRGKKETNANSSNSPTHLRLQMNPGGAVEVGKENIWHWYVVTFSREKHFSRTKELIKDVPGHMVFVVFDKPINMKQPIVECPGTPLPFWEEKSRSARHLILDFNNEVSNKVIDIKIAINE